MKQLLILSGKGGTGKTTLAGAFIKLAQAKAYADVDVDAPNLHLILEQDVIPQIADYYGMDKAYIDMDICNLCGICEEHCRFNAISFVEDAFLVDYYACEGCGVCQAICPVDAAKMVPDIAGELKLFTNDAVFSTAQLKMGNGNSGMLVTEVKKTMQEAAISVPLAIIDGSPGIGCPVIASLSGVDMVLIVAEPSLSGVSDMKRIINTAEQFQAKIAVCINKYDTNVEKTDMIINMCKEINLPFVGRVPYDTEAVKAINNGQTIVDIDCIAGEAAKGIFAEVLNILNV
ncbi:MAG TPA: 4Fe-4S binding protein [Syntrophomonadaceae bacterium]|nr:4Fe-4S binding protein [Syntrophomonadaceae bacterium]